MRVQFCLRVLIDQVAFHLLPNFDTEKDTMFVAGSVPSLGDWHSLKAIEMKLMKKDDSIPDLSQLEWQATVDINPSEVNNNNDDEIGYKYFVAQKTSMEGKIFIQQVEAEPRTFKLRDDITLSDQWPLDTQTLPECNKNAGRIEYGWLLDDEHEIHFHLFGNPLQIWSNFLNGRKVGLQIVPFKITREGLSRLDDYVLRHFSFDQNKLINHKITEQNALNHPDIYTSYRLRCYEKPTNLLFQINIHENIEQETKLSDKILATCYYKPQKNLIDTSIVEVELPVQNAVDNQMIGNLKIEVLHISCLNDTANYLVRPIYAYDFNRKCVPVGHRGMGKTFDAFGLAETHVMENTIESFREAYKNGAQMVEFDVVLTKDKRPIIYHDFSICIDAPNNEFLNVSVNQMTYDEIKQNKIYSHKIMKEHLVKTEGFNPNNFTSKHMFPTLKEMCRELDPRLGFNVEIKYPNELENEANEADDYIKWLNRNQYVNIILKELYQYCTNDERCVILSTFDPNLCSMLRMKQNKYPVLFLTNGSTTRYKKYRDSRCKTFQISLNNSRMEYFHGIVAHAEELALNVQLMKLLPANQETPMNHFLGYLWGDDLNKKEMRDLFSKHGINGIINDRICEVPGEENTLISTATTSSSAAT